MNARSSFAGWVVVAALAAPLEAVEVPLLDRPDDGATVIARVDSSNPAVVSGSPALGAEGWYWSEYDAMVPGHVPAARVGKNFRIDPGTAVRATASAGAPEVARIDDGDSVEIVASGGAWIEIRLAKKVPVYFRKPRGGTARAAAPAKVRPAAEAPAAAAPSSIVVSESEQASARPPRKPKPPPGTPMRVLSGTLVRGRGTESGPRFTLSLEQRGRRLAYVDISRLFVRDLRPFLENEVIVMGEVSSISPGGTELVIHARTLRIKP